MWPDGLGMASTFDPKIVEQFEHMGQSLPGATLFLIAASDFIRSYGIFVLLALVMAVRALKKALKKPDLRLKYDRLLLKAGMLGKVSRGLNTARFARTLSILNASAVPLLEAMRISADVLDNTFMKQAIGEATLRVREGTSLRGALDQTKLFPPMMLPPRKLPPRSTVTRSSVGFSASMTWSATCAQV